MSRLLEVANGLYGSDLGEFTAARDAQAKQLRDDDEVLAREVRSLRKPATAAWVVNQLVRDEAEQVAQVLAVGEALREAQRSMSAEDLRTLTRQRRQLTAALTQRARALARERGARVSDAVAGQVEATLSAAMIDVDCAAAVRSGLLVAPLSSTGVDDDAGAVAAVAVPQALGFAASAREPGVHAGAPAPQASVPQLRVVADPEADARARQEAHQEARREADAALEEARTDLAAADRTAEQARTVVADLEARALQLQSEIEELRRRVADLETTAEEVDDDLADAEQTVAEAVEARTEAERAHHAAQEVHSALKD